MTTDTTVVRRKSVTLTIMGVLIAWAAALPATVVSAAEGFKDQLNTSRSVNSTTVFFGDDWFDLETGDVIFCTGGCGSFDFRFAFDSTNVNPIVFRKRADLEVAFVDGMSFDEVNLDFASGLNFLPNSIDEPFDNDDTIVVRMTNGDMYKVGNPQCFVENVSFHSVCTQQNGESEVSFDWQLLEPDADSDGVADPVDNCLGVANPSQLDTDNDGYGNACDGDLNNDCAVNFVDISALASVFLCSDQSPECQNADLDGSGSVNFLDYATLTSLFLQPPGPSAQDGFCSLPPVIHQPLLMNASLSYDLDTATQGGTSQFNMDIVFTASTTTGFIRPQHGANIALWGASRPSPEDCLGTAMTLEQIRFDDNNVEIGDWFCARTNNGGLSRFQLTAANELPAAFQITVYLTTWVCEECETRYDPTPLPGIVGWFDADDADAFELDGNTVVDWQDRSGNIEFMGNAIAGHRPTFTPNGINGRGSVSFDGVDDRLFSNSIVNLASGYTVFIAARNDIRQNFNGLLSLRTTSTSGTHAAFEVYWQAGTTDNASGNIVVAANRQTASFSFMESHNAGPPFGTAYSVAARASGNSAVKRIWVDGENQSLITGGSSSDLTPNALLRQLCLGQGFGSTVSGTILDGDIGEVLVFNRALTDAELEFVSNYIDIKWGIN